MNRHAFAKKAFTPLALAIWTLFTGTDSRLAAQVAPKPADPVVKLVKTVHDCWSFKETLIHPNRYVLSTTKITPFPPSAVYDIRTGEIKVIDVRKLRGMPIPPQATGLDAKRLQLTGDYWNIRSIDITHYDAERNRAGVIMVKEETRRTFAGNPRCAMCRGESQFVEKYQRFYCFNCRKYVDEKDYLTTVRTIQYADIDIASGSVRWIVPVAEGSFNELGSDPTGEYYYFHDSVSFYDRNTTNGAFNVYRFNTDSRKIDWKYAIIAPVRRKEKAPGTYSMRAFASPDYSRLVFWEYDEEYEPGSRKGWLQNPPAQAFVVNVREKNHFTVPVPSTPYASMIDRDNKYLLFGSNQYGTLHRIDLAAQKEDLTIKGTYGMFQSVLSSSGKYLYVFTKSVVEVRSWPDLRPVKHIQLGGIFPGVQKLLCSEAMLVTADGRHAVIGILKRSESGPWYSSDTSDGFNLLQLSD